LAPDFVVVFLEEIFGQAKITVFFWGGERQSLPLFLSATSPLQGGKTSDGKRYGGEAGEGMKTGEVVYR